MKAGGLEFRKPGCHHVIYTFLIVALERVAACVGMGLMPMGQAIPPGT